MERTYSQMRTKTYLQFITEKLNPNFKGLIINNVQVKFTGHSLERHNERTDFLHEEDWKIILARITLDVMARPKGYYLYFSKSYNQGVVLFWDQRNIFIVTILPKGNKFAKSDTKLAIVEACIMNKFSNKFNNELYMAEVD